MLPPAAGSLRIPCWRRAGRSIIAARAASRSPISTLISRHVADDLAVVRSCWADSVNHPQAVYQINTGSVLMGKPSMGSWVSYGLGTENQNLPAFVVLPDPGGGIKGGPPAYGAGFLPATHQGTLMRGGESPILDLRPSVGTSRSNQRRVLDLVGRLNAHHFEPRYEDAELSARIQSYELAFRMQIGRARGG